MVVADSSVAGGDQQSEDGRLGLRRAIVACPLGAQDGPIGIAGQIEAPAVVFERFHLRDRLGHLHVDHGRRRRASPGDLAVVGDGQFYLGLLAGRYLVGLKARVCTGRDAVTVASAVVAPTTRIRGCMSVSWLRGGEWRVGDSSSSSDDPDGQ